MVVEVLWYSDLFTWCVNQGLRVRISARHLCRFGRHLARGHYYCRAFKKNSIETAEVSIGKQTYHCYYHYDYHHNHCFYYYYLYYCFIIITRGADGSYKAGPVLNLITWDCSPLLFKRTYTHAHLYMHTHNIPKHACPHTHIHTGTHVAQRYNHKFVTICTIPANFKSRLCSLFFALFYLNRIYL